MIHFFKQLIKSNNHHIFSYFYLGVGPFGVVAPFGVVDTAELVLLWPLGVEGVKGVMFGRAVEELLGVRGTICVWGVEGALVLTVVCI